MATDLVNQLSGLEDNENLICMDLLNYWRYFFCVPDSPDYRGIVDFHEDIRNAKRKIKNFIDATANSEYKIISVRF